MVKAAHTDLDECETHFFFFLDLPSSPLHRVIPSVSIAKQVENEQEMILNQSQYYCEAIDGNTEKRNIQIVCEGLLLQSCSFLSFLSLAASCDRVFNSFYKRTAPPHVR